MSELAKLMGSGALGPRSMALGMGNNDNGQDNGSISRVTAPPPPPNAQRGTVEAQNALAGRTTVSTSDVPANMRRQQNNDRLASGDEPIPLHGGIAAAPAGEDPARAPNAPAVRPDVVSDRNIPTQAPADQHDEPYAPYYNSIYGKMDRWLEDRQKDIEDSRAGTHATLVPFLADGTFGFGRTLARVAALYSGQFPDRFSPESGKRQSTVPMELSDVLNLLGGGSLTRVPKEAARLARNTPSQASKSLAAESAARHGTPPAAVPGVLPPRPAAVASGDEAVTAATRATAHGLPQEANVVSDAAYTTGRLRDPRDAGRPIPLEEYYSGKPPIGPDGRRLERTPEGVELTAPRIIGRTYADEPDQGLRYRDAMETARLFVNRIRRAEKGELPPHMEGEFHLLPDPDLNQVIEFVRTLFNYPPRGIPEIVYGRYMTAQKAQRIVAHELGHALVKKAPGLVDANKIPAEAVAQMRQIYSDLAPPRRGHQGLIGPEDFKYPAEKVLDELVVETIRAYMFYPQYAKQHRAAAEWIRRHLNENPEIASKMQLNSWAPWLLPAGGLDVARRQQETGDGE